MAETYNLASIDPSFGAQYAIVRIHRWPRGAIVPGARVVIDTAPGEAGQLDDGNGPIMRTRAAEVSAGTSPRR
jgi:hypothetical protein